LCRKTKELPSRGLHHERWEKEKAGPSWEKKDKVTVEKKTYANDLEGGLVDRRGPATARSKFSPRVEKVIDGDPEGLLEGGGGKYDSSKGRSYIFWNLSVGGELHKINSVRSTFLSAGKELFRPDESPQHPEKTIMLEAEKKSGSVVCWQGRVAERLHNP